MKRPRLSLSAEASLEKIYVYSLERWGRTRAVQYTDAILDVLDQIVARPMVGRPIPSSFAVSGHFRKAQHHMIYWRMDSDGVPIVVAILHERMHQAARLSEALVRG